MRARPGLGLFVVLGAHALAVSFFWAVMREPLLDRVWGLEQRLAAGAGPLTRDEFALLQEALWRYPSLAGDLLDGAPAGLIGLEGEAVETGYAYLLRREAKAMLVEVTPASGAGPTIGVRLRTLSFEQSGRAGLETPFGAALPDGPLPLLVELRFDADPLGADASVVVRLRGRP